MNKMVRIAKLSPEEFSEIHCTGDRTIYGVRAYTASKRYSVFMKKGTKCVSCGAEGKFFALEKHKKQKTDRYHFNLYAFTKNGNELLMTKDHIIPKSKGGKNSLINLQPMCTRCDKMKGNGDKKKGSKKKRLPSIKKENIFIGKEVIKRSRKPFSNKESIAIVESFTKFVINNESFAAVKLKDIKIPIRIVGLAEPEYLTERRKT